MIEPLSKLTAAGERYQRPRVVEVAIAEALEMPEAMLEARAEIRDRESREWLPSECLEHLIRRAQRLGNIEACEALLRSLFRRCLRNLSVTVQSRNIPNSAEVRADVISRLGELIASDPEDSLFRLDYYEIRFDGAFGCLRKDAIRHEVGRRRTSKQGGVADIGDVVGLAVDLESGWTLPSPATQEGRVLLRELLDAIEDLPPNERDAIVMVRLQGYPIESADPRKASASTRLGTRPRTLRSRLARGLAKLERFKET